MNTEITEKAEMNSTTKTRRHEKNSTTDKYKQKLNHESHEKGNLTIDTTLDAQN
jgi:hypothetical protein